MNRSNSFDENGVNSVSPMSSKACFYFTHTIILSHFLGTADDNINHRLVLVTVLIIHTHTQSRQRQDMLILRKVVGSLFTGIYYAMHSL